MPAGIVEVGSCVTYRSTVSNAVHVVDIARVDAVLSLGVEAGGSGGIGGRGGVLGLGHSHEAGDDDGSETHVGELRRLLGIKYGISHKRSNSQAERL